MMKAAAWGLAALTVWLGGCSAIGASFGPDKKIKVEEIGRAMMCTTHDEKASIQVLGPAIEAMLWQRRSSIDLTGERQLPDGYYIAVEMGYRETGGYGFIVGPQALVDGNTVRLSGTFIEPKTPADATPEPTSPCVLLRLSSGGWSSIELRDQSGKRRARLSIP